MSNRDMEGMILALSQLEIELPSWGMSRGGTRFGRYPTGDEAVSFDEKAADCALVQRLTGATPAIATHFPWDGSTPSEVENTLESIKRHGLRPGAVNSNTFSMQNGTPMDERIRLGSVTNPFTDVRDAAIRHQIDCLEIMRRFGSKQLSVWLADGSNSPGQQSLFDQADWLSGSLAAVYQAMHDDERMLVEYKFFEPGFYATAIPDWGVAYSLADRLGERALVLVDLGHHPQATNIEQIVANLIRLEKFGGFHFNDRKYGDDDLATGSIDPAQLFRIFVTLVEADRRGLKAVRDVSFVIDQSHNIKNPIEEMLESVEAIQSAYARALLVDWDALARARSQADAVLADRILRNAFFSPQADELLIASRQSRGLPEDPLVALRESGELERRAQERAGRMMAGAGLGSG